MRCPCVDCPDKGCGEKHDTCEGYQAWKAEHNAATQWARDQVPAMSNAAKKGHERKLKNSKSRKWNVKTRNGGDGKW